MLAGFSVSNKMPVGQAGRMHGHTCSGSHFYRVTGAIGATFFMSSSEPACYFLL